MWLLRKPAKGMFLDWRGYLVGLSLITLATIFKLLAQPDIISTPNSLPYILAIIITAVFFGFGPAIFASILSVFTYEFFFVAPLNAFKVPSMQDILVLIIFFLVAVIISFLTSSLRQKSEEAIRESTLRKRHEMDLMQLRDHLEELVQQRTIELEEAREKLEFKVKERTAELAESEEKYRLLVENANEAVIVFQDNLCKFFNDKAMELTGLTRKELASISFSSLVHPDDRAMVIERYRNRLRGEKVPNTYEFRITIENGELKWIVIHAVSITWEGKPAVLALLTDITEHKSMEQELINYAHRITQVQEEERKRIAYELHDDTAQYLSILKLQLGGLLSSGKIKDPKLVEKLEFLEKDAGRAVDDVRRYSHELRPGVLEHLGLRAAIEQIAEDMNKLSPTIIEVIVDGEEPILSEDVKLGFFRIAQEALNNCRKHAKASKAFVDLIFLPNLIRMSINDNGVGFDMKEVKTRTARKGNLGLISMQERARLIGADLEIESDPGKGTTISVEKPL